MWNNAVSRREIMRLSAAGVAGASVSGWFGTLAEHAARAAVPARPKSCILLWMSGGPSHHDTFDPKPDAPADIRGDLKPIDTSVPGIQVSEKFPKFAKLMQPAALLRGMSTDEAEHGRARIYVHTGYKPGQGLENLQPPVPADDFDDRASVLDKLDQGFARTSQAGAAVAHATTFRRTLELMRSDKTR